MKFVTACDAGLKNRPFQGRLAGYRRKGGPAR